MDGFGNQTNVIVIGSNQPVQECIGIKALMRAGRFDETDC